MRTFHYTALLFTTVVLISTGCRQTSGPVGPSPLTPANTGALTPQATQAPSLNPFGGSTTRVTPPATGAFSVPNNYLGGAAVGHNGVVNSGLVQQNQNVTGSGVQVAGWNSTNPGAFANQQAFAQNPIGSGIGPNPNNNPNYRDPVSSGMRVIDLTGAPNPPGYQRPQQSFTSPNQQQQFGQFQSPNYQAPNYQSQGSGSRQFNSQGQAPPPQTQSFQEGVRAINVPPRSEIAQGSFGPAPAGSFPRTATAPGPSTEPIQPTGNQPSGQTQENLLWRRPGTSF